MSWGRAFRILFVVVACLSLLLNAVMVGVGVRLSSLGFLGGGIGQSLTEIPRETRLDYLAGLRAERAELRALTAELRERRRAMLSAMAAEPADPAAIERAMREVRAATSRLQTAAHAAMLKTAAARAEPEE